MQVVGASSGEVDSIGDVSWMLHSSDGCGTSSIPDLGLRMETEALSADGAQSVSASSACSFTLRAQLLPLHQVAPINAGNDMAVQELRREVEELRAELRAMKSKMASPGSEVGVAAAFSYAGNACESGNLIEAPLLSNDSAILRTSALEEIHSPFTCAPSEEYEVCNAAGEMRECGHLANEKLATIQNHAVSLPVPPLSLLQKPEIPDCIANDKNLQSSLSQYLPILNTLTPRSSFRSDVTPLTPVNENVSDHSFVLRSPYTALAGNEAITSAAASPCKPALGVPVHWGTPQKNTSNDFLRNNRGNTEPGLSPQASGESTISKPTPDRGSQVDDDARTLTPRSASVPSSAAALLTPSPRAFNDSQLPEPPIPSRSLPSNIESLSNSGTSSREQVDTSLYLEKNSHVAQSPPYPNAPCNSFVELASSNGETPRAYTSSYYFIPPPPRQCVGALPPPIKEKEALIEDTKSAEPKARDLAEPKIRPYKVIQSSIREAETNAVSENDHDKPKLFSGPLPPPPTCISTPSTALTLLVDGANGSRSLTCTTSVDQFEPQLLRPAATTVLRGTTTLICPGSENMLQATYSNNTRPLHFKTEDYMIDWHTRSQSPSPSPPALGPLTAAAAATFAAVKTRISSTTACAGDGQQLYPQAIQLTSHPATTGINPKWNTPFGLPNQPFCNSAGHQSMHRQSSRGVLAGPSRNSASAPSTIPNDGSRSSVGRNSVSAPTRTPTTRIANLSRSSSPGTRVTAPHRLGSPCRRTSPDTVPHRSISPCRPAIAPQRSCSPHRTRPILLEARRPDLVLGNSSDQLATGIGDSNPSLVRVIPWSDFRSADVGSVKGIQIDCFS